MGFGAALAHNVLKLSNVLKNYSGEGLNICWLKLLEIARLDSPGWPSMD